MKEDWLEMQRKTQKAIWRYINSKSKTKESIGNLLKDLSKLDSQVAESDKEKAEVLADYFSSVFTNEPQGPTPTLEGLKTPEEEMEEIKVTQDDVQKILPET